MKIILNAIQYKRNSTGIGYMAYHWFSNVIKLKKANDSIDIILSKDSPSIISVNINGVRILRSPFNKNQIIKRNIYELFPPKDAAKQPGVFVSIDSKIPFFMPRNLKKIQIITDLATYRMEWVYQRSRVFYWRYMFKRAIRIADKVIAISGFTKQEIIDILHISPDKIEVIYCAAANDCSRVEEPAEQFRVREKYGLNKKYMLYVGNFNPRKNLERIIKAFDLLKKIYGIEHKLIIVGEKGWKFNQKEALKDIVSIEDISFLNYVESNDLSVIYSMADLFVFTTLYEGFGIPLIESQRCGVPVLASNTSCFEEVAGKGALYVDPYNESDICEGMYQILSDYTLRQQLIKEGYNNSERFSWEKSAEQLYKTIEEVYSK